MQQNQQLVATMLRKMDFEEAEKKVAETVEAAKKAAEAALTRNLASYQLGVLTQKPVFLTRKGFE